MARILVVDDSGVARKTLCNLLISLGHTVAGEAVNGTEALAEYARLRPDIVTMDLMMDGSDGAQATSDITAVFPEARIVVVSARQDQQVIIDALERGARHFIVKPIQQNTLGGVLNNILQQDFDLKKHLERVRKLKETEDSRSLVQDTVDKYLPPYAIHVQDNSLIHVFIYPGITVTSCKTLLMEMEEYLEVTARILFDFGKMPRLDPELVVQINTLIKTIENHSGSVKSISSNKTFIDFIAEIPIQNTANLLADTLRYFED